MTSRRPHSLPKGHLKLVHTPALTATARVLRRKPAPRPLEQIDPRSVERAFAALARTISRASSVAEARLEQLAIIQTLSRSRACFILEHEPQSDLLQVCAVRGRNSQRVTAARPGEGPTGLAFSEHRIVRDDQLHVVPLGDLEHCRGCLALLQPRFELSDELLLALSQSVCAGVEVSRLRDDSMRRTKDLQTAVAGLKAMEKSRENLLAEVSHDLKNPLSTLKTYQALLLNRTLGDLHERQLKALGTCERSADRLLRLINDLLLVSRLQSGKMQLADRPFGLKTATGDALASLSAIATRAQVRMVLADSPELYVRGDPERLTEALSTLIENAVHRSPTEGTVEVSLANEDGLATVTVTDHGAPIDPADLPHVFDPFHRSKGPDPMRLVGGGLALSLVARTSHLHGGKVEARSAPQTTSFRLVLPLFAAAAPLTEVPHPPRSGAILLVEDDVDCREVLQQVLEMEGYPVLATGSASQARALLEKARPALVLLDLRLSEEDGMSVLHFIRGSEELSNLAVYIISGGRDLAALSAGEGINRIDGFFEKPLQLGRVLDTVKAVVRKERTPAL